VELPNYVSNLLFNAKWLLFFARALGIFNIFKNENLNTLNTVHLASIVALALLIQFLCLNPFEISFPPFIIVIMGLLVCILLDMPRNQRLLEGGVDAFLPTVGRFFGDIWGHLTHITFITLLRNRLHACSMV
jgi:hypothetical protein